MTFKGGRRLTVKVTKDLLAITIGVDELARIAHDNSAHDSHFAIVDPRAFAGEIAVELTEPDEMDYADRTGLEILLERACDRVIADGSPAIEYVDEDA